MRGGPSFARPRPPSRRHLWAPARACHAARLLSLCVLTVVAKPVAKTTVSILDPGPNWSKLIQRDPNRSKLIQIDPNRSKKIQIAPNRSSTAKLETVVFTTGLATTVKTHGDVRGGHAGKGRNTKPALASHRSGQYVLVSPCVLTVVAKPVVT